MKHSITLLLGQVALYTTWGCVLGHCPVEEQICYIPSKRSGDGVSLQNAVEAMLVKYALCSK